MCATWRSCVTCGTCPLCIIFYKFGHRMPVPGRFAGCHRTSDAGSGRFAGCHRTSVAGSGPVRRIPPDVGCRLQPVCRMPSDIRSRFRPVRQMPPVRWMPVRRYTNRTSDAIRRLPPEPITIGFRTAGCHRYPSPSDAGPPVTTGTSHHRMPGHRSSFGLSKTFTWG